MRTVLYGVEIRFQIERFTAFDDEFCSLHISCQFNQSVNIGKSYGLPWVGIGKYYYNNINNNHNEENLIKLIDFSKLDLCSSIHNCHLQCLSSFIDSLWTLDYGPVLRYTSILLQFFYNKQMYSFLLKEYLILFIKWQHTVPSRHIIWIRNTTIQPITENIALTTHSQNEVSVFVIAVCSQY